MTFNIIPDDIIRYELPKYDFWKLTIYDRYILDKFEFNKNNTFRVKYKFKNTNRGINKLITRIIEINKLDLASNFVKKIVFKVIRCIIVDSIKNYVMIPNKKNWSFLQ